MDISHWPQVIGVVKAPMEGSKQLINNNNSNERRGTTTSTRPHQKDQAVNCPRCNSTNTKFCYYNNYSLTQPRYFCKTCRRYWTEGGSLRNVPVGGGSRKNKRPSSSSMSNSPSSSNKKPNIHDHHDHDHDHHHHNPLLLPPSLNFPLHHQNPSNKLMIHQGQDLNLAYPPTSSDHHHNMPTSRMSFVNPSTTTTTTTVTTTTTNNASPTSSSSQHVSAMELLKNSSGIASCNNNNTRGLMMSSFMPMPLAPEFSSFANLGHHEFKPSLISFGLDHPHHHQYHHQGGYSNGNNNSDATNNVHGHGHGHGVVQDSTSSARLLFPSTTEDLKQVSNDHHQDHDRSTHHQFEEINRGQGDSSTNNVYNWNGMLGGGSW